MQPRSARLTDAQRRFIDQSSFNFTKEVRSWLDEERVRNAAGVCAVCGKIAYVGGHTVTSGGSPMGNFLNLNRHEEIDTCDNCHDDLMDDLTDDTGSSPSLEYCESLPSYYVYRAERDAVIDAQPDTAWAPLVTNRNEMTQEDRLAAIGTWIDRSNPKDRYGQKSGIDYERLVKSVLGE